MVRILRILLPIVAGVMLFHSCSRRAILTVPFDYTAPQQQKQRQVIAVFFDGTRDRQWKDSAKRSHVQNSFLLLDTTVKSLYVEGVGAGNRLKDAKDALTTNERIMRGYRFLSENYQPGDSICLFGFSRGANQCRILSGIIYTIGVLDLKGIQSGAVKHELLLKVYDQYVAELDATERKIKLATFLDQWNESHPKEKITYDTANNIRIELMGLWDTVEALKINDRVEATTPIPSHLNQLYNVKKLFHAVSLDDNRSFNYTPILATHKDVKLHPGQDINAIVEEVWFNGSHKDVGGGHKKKAALQHISLKWMLSRLEPYHLFRDTALSADYTGEVHNMRKGYLRVTSPGDTMRSIRTYWREMNPSWNNHRIKVHRSVIRRLNEGIVQSFKTKKHRPDWYDWPEFACCFDRDPTNPNRRIFRADCKCIEVVDDGPAR